MPAPDRETPSTRPQFAAPQFLVAWDPWPVAFARNLSHAFRPAPAPLRLSSEPADFWPDVFVGGARPTRGFAISAVYHTALLSLLYALPVLLGLAAPRPEPQQAEPKTLTFYQVSEYLPPIPAKSATSKVPRRGDPAFARQAIISVPKGHDNREQTVLDPSTVKLAAQHVPLPNMAVWTATPTPPEADAARTSPRLVLPTLPVEVVQPPPELQTAATLTLPPVPVEVVQPAVDVSSTALSRLDMPAMPQASVVEPPPVLEKLRHRLGEINMARAEIEPRAPKFPVAEQQASLNTESKRSPRRRQETVAAPPAPNVPAGNSSANSGRLIALGLQPGSVQGPITLPDANRRGEFAATPEGKAGASGVPDLPAVEPRAGANKTEGDEGAGPGKDSMPIFIGGQDSPGPHADAVVVQTPPGAAPRELRASLRPPDIVPPAAEPAEDAGKIEDEIFAGKRYYSLTLNMPNLTSAGGSWVIRFAELEAKAVRGDLSAPVAVDKVDPAYPPDLMRDRVEGTVTLYAVIRRDGTVCEVRILRGVDVRLDENARTALARWHFRPAVKNGVAVDLEAVVQIPFKLRKPPF